MAEARRFLVRFLGDASGLSKTNDEVGKSADGVSARMGKLGTAIASAYVTERIIEFGRTAINVASDIEESTNKVGVLYGEAAKDILDASKTAAQSAGLSERAYLDLAGSVGLLGQAAGKSGTDLSDFGRNLIARAADVGSFNNATTPEVVEAFGAALRGEMEPARRFGVMLDDAALRAQALKMGLIETTKEALDPQAKSLAAYELIMQSTQVAAGDFANTSDGLANSQKIVGAQIENIQGQLGKSLLPIMTTLVGVVSDAATSFGSLNEGTQTAILQLALFGGGTAAAIKGFLALRAALTGLTAATGMAYATMLPLAALLAGAGFLYVQYAREKGRATAATEDFTDALKAEAQGQADAVTQALARQIADLADEAEAAGLTVQDLAAVIRGDSVPAFEELSATVEGYGGNLARGGGEAERVALANVQLAERIDMLRGSFDDARTAVDRDTTAKEAAEAVAQELGTTLEDVTDATEDQTDATEDQRVAEERRRQSIESVTRALNEQLDATLGQISGELQLRSATRSTADAIADLGEKIDSGSASADELAEAQDGAAEAALRQAGAAAKLAEDQARAAGGTLSAAQSAQIQRDELRKVADTLAPGSPLRVQLEEYIAALGRIPGAVNTQITTTGGRTGVNGGGRTVTGVRAAGGPVLEGNTYLVGENGPELITPDDNANVVPMGAASGGGGSTSIVINAPAGMTPEGIVAAIQRYERRNGKGWRR